MSGIVAGPPLRAQLELPFERAKERVAAALTEEGFGVLTEIDVKATLREKLDVDFRGYCILGACNPALAHRALSADLEVGLLLPCNVIVFERNEGSEVSMLDPVLMLELVQDPDLEPVAREARSRLERVIEMLASSR